MIKIAKSPKHLSKESKLMWRKIILDYGIEDEAGLKVLRSACEAFDRAQSAREQIDKDGLIFHDDKGKPKPHPLIPVERDSRAAFLAGLKHLNLDLEPLRDRGRPGGK